VKKIKGRKEAIEGTLVRRSREGSICEEALTVIRALTLCAERGKGKRKKKREGRKIGGKANGAVMERRIGRDSPIKSQLPF